MPRLRAALPVVALVLALVPAAHAAAPRFILVARPAPQQPAVLATWRENLELMLSVANTRPRAGLTVADLHGRPRLHMGLFWGWPDRRPKWPSQGNQHGWFYPAHGALPAAVLMTAGGVRERRLAPPALLQILGRHRVPLRL